MLLRGFLCGLAFVAGAITAAPPALAQTYPTRTIKIVVPFPPGGPTDVMARLVAERLQKRFGRSVIVESHPGGGGGTVGAKAVAMSPPDGYTLLLALTGTLTISPAIYKNSGYDTLKNFAAVAKIGTGGQVLAVNSSLPVKTMKELVDYAKAHPSKLSYASPGFGTQPHLLGELFKFVTHTDIVHVPYKGSAPAMIDLLSGQVQLMWDAPTIMQPHVQSGQIRAVAVSGDKRMPSLPDVPTAAEAGYPKMQATLWSGVVAPAGTPPAIIAGLNQAINAELATDSMRATLAKFSIDPDPMTPQAFQAFLASEVKKYGEVVAAAGIKAQ